MNFQMHAPPAYFVHVPKTGGISLGTLLDRAYPASACVRLNPPVLAKLDVEKLKSFRFYHAMHQGRSMFDLIGRPNLLTITMLREPIERSISQMLYLRRIVGALPHTFTPEYLEEVAPVLRADFRGRLDHTAFVKACDPQIRTLGIREDYRPLLKGHPDVTSGRSIVRPYPLPPLMDLKDRDLLLRNACDWVGEMQVVGLTEFYTESVLMICGALGLPPPPRLPRLNANPKRSNTNSSYREHLPSVLIEQLEELTKHDQQLYIYARERFQQQWDRFRTSPNRTYSILPYVSETFMRPVRVATATIKPVAKHLLSALKR